MAGCKSLGILGLTGVALVSGAIAACAQPVAEPSHGSSSAVTAAAFDRNSVLDDKSLRDSDTISADDLQKILDKNPWNTTSVLATYTEGGKTAAQIMADTAKAHGINPLEMIVRVQMEQGLVNKTTAEDATIAKAFGCGCADNAACSATYKGFAAQAECAAGVLRRAMDAAVTPTGTVSGWAKGKAKDSSDGLTITPKNAATAALYTYTPWVGESGGGRMGVGGVSLHGQVWNRFADAAGYAVSTPAPPVAPSDADASADPPADPPVDPNQDPVDPSAPSDPSADDAGAPSADSGPTGDGGAKGDGTTKTAPPANGSADGKIINENGENNPAPSSNGPPPTGKINTKPEELPNASDADLAGKPKNSGGCSTTGSSNGTSNAWLVGLALALVASRRRSGAR